MPGPGDAENPSDPASRATPNSEARPPGRVVTASGATWPNAPTPASRSDRAGYTNRASFADPFPRDLARYLAASTGLPQPTAVRVVADVATYFSETVEEFVRRRHIELR